MVITNLRTFSAKQILLLSITLFELVASSLEKKVAAFSEQCSWLVSSVVDAYWNPWEMHITKDVCFLGRGTLILNDVCFPSRGTHITRDICFLNREADITRDMYFLGRGNTCITRDMCFLGRGTHITRDVCFLGKETHIIRVCVS